MSNDDWEYLTGCLLEISRSFRLRVARLLTGDLSGSDTPNDIECEVGSLFRGAVPTTPRTSELAKAHKHQERISALGFLPSLLGNFTDAGDRSP